MSEVEDSVITSYASGPTKRAHQIVDLKAVLFDKYEKSITEVIDNETIDHLPQIDEKPLSEIITDIISIIDHTPLNKLIIEPPKLLSDFKSLVLSKIPSKTFYLIVNTWPTCIQIPTPHVDLIFKLLVRMTRMAQNPEKFLAYLICGLLPRLYSTSKNNYAIAASTIKTDSDDDIQWAVITNDAEFKILKVDQSGKLWPTFTGKVFRTKIDDDGTGVCILDQSGTEISHFTPTDPSVIRPWTELFEQRRPSFFRTFTKTAKFVPDIVYGSFMALLGDSNMTAVRALATPTIFSVEELAVVYEAAITAGSYTQKVNVVLGAIFADTFEHPSSTVDLLSSDKSPLHPLYDFYSKKFGQPYLKRFIFRLVEYLRVKETVDEKTFFTALKYVLASSNLVPPELQHLASVLKSFVVTKFNSMDAAVRILGDFFIHSFVGAIKDPTKVFPNVTISHPEVLAQAGGMLEAALKLQRLPFEFDSYNRRLERMSGSIERFLLALGDIEYVAPDESISHEAPSYAVPPFADVLGALEKLFGVAAAHAEELADEFELLQREGTFATSQLGWAYAFAIERFFAEDYEDGRSVEEKMAAATPPPIPPLDFVAALLPRSPVAVEPQRPYASPVRKVETPIAAVGEKQYVKVKRRTKKVLKGNEAPGDVVAVEVVKSEVMEDGSHKTVVKKKIRKTKKEPVKQKESSSSSSDDSEK